MGYQLAGTPGTSDFFNNLNIPMISLEKPPSEEESSVAQWIRSKKIDLVINLPPEGASRRDEITAGYLMRRLAVDFGASLLTNQKCAELLIDALSRGRQLPCTSVEEFVRTAPHRVRRLPGAP
jgi:hypothetical protein